MPISSAARWLKAWVKFSVSSLSSTIAAAAMVDLMGGRISMSFASMPSAITHVRSGKLRGIAVTTSKRAKTVPDLPTLAESGLPGFETGAWQGFLAPAGTPQTVIHQLNAATKKVLQRPAMVERLAVDGAEPVGSTPAEFSQFVRNEVAKWLRVVKAAGIRID